MPYVIKQLDNVVNIIVEGSTDYLTALSTDSVAQLRRKEAPLDDQIYFTSNTGFETAAITFDGTIKYQDNGGAATLWAGTIEDLVDKLNTEYFTKSGGTSVGTQSLNDKLSKKEIGKIISLSADDGASWAGYGFTFMQPSVIFNLDVGAAQSFDSTRMVDDATGLVAELNSLQNLYFFEVIDENNLAISEGTETVENLVSLTLDTDFGTFVYTIPYTDTTDQELSNLDAAYQLQKKTSKSIEVLKDHAEVKATTSVVGEILTYPNGGTLNQAVTLIAANTGRRKLAISITGGNALLRKQAATVGATTRRGIPIYDGTTFFIELNNDNSIYQGEWSIINMADTEVFDFSVTEDSI